MACIAGLTHAGPRPSPFKLQHKERVSGDTSLYRFAFPDASLPSGLHVASCLLVQAPIGPDGAMVTRPYTPVSFPETLGHLDLVVKTYPQGAMSRHLDALRVGDTLDFRGPISKLPITKDMKQSMGMVAGGTGITPMLQVIDEVLRTPGDVTTLSLVFASKSVDDILVKARLDDLAYAHPARFQVTYVAERAPPGWGGVVGFITPGLLREKLPAPADNILVLVCGPPGMMAAISGDKAPDKSQGPLSGALKELGYTESQVFKF